MAEHPQSGSRAGPSSSQGTGGDASVEALERQVESLRRELAECRQRERERAPADAEEAARALRESERHHRQQAAELELIYRTAPVGLCVVDTRLRYVHINDRLAELNGIPAEAHLGKTVREVVPEVAIRAEPLLRRVLATGEPILNIELSAEIPAQSGVQRTWVSQYWPLKDGERVVGINVVAEEVTELRRLEDTHRRDHEFRTLAENATDVVARFDRTLRRVYVNPAIESVLGRPRAEILGKSNRELGLPAEVADELDIHLQQVFATGRAQTMEAALPTPKGDRIFDSSLVPEPGSSGEVETVLAISRDITERKQAEAALKAYAQGQDFLVGTALRLLQPFEMAELFDFVTNQIHHLAEGGIVLFSEFDLANGQTILRAVGCTTEEQAKIRQTLGRDPIGITLDFPETVRKRMLPGELDRLTGGLCELAFYQLPRAICSALERELDIRNVYAMACSVEQDLLGTVAVLTRGDGLLHKRLIESVVTEAALALKRNRVEEVLRSERNFFDTVFDTQGAIVAVLDPDYRIVRLNRAYYAMAGFPRDSMIGRTFRDLMDATSAETVELDGLASRRTTGEFESLVRVSGGRPRNVSWRTTVRRSEAGDIEYIIATGIDVTERKHIEDALRRANGELQQFAYVASHDLRAPLRAVSNLSSWLENDLSAQLSGESRHHLQLLRERVRLMDALIEGLLSYSRAGGQTRYVEAVDSGQLVGDVIKTLDVPDGIHLVVAEEMPLLVTDRTKLQQVFANLLGNAIKYHDRTDGHVWVSTREAGEWIEFSVADDGPGIPPEYHETIFRMLQRGPAAKAQEGTGIGLAVVKKQVESVGGRIGVESTPGHGATFRFTWPKLMEAETATF